MAKGFTVKANAPKKKEPDWDIDAIKARMKGKTIVFCLPGRGVSYIFLKNFVQIVNLNFHTHLNRMFFIKTAGSVLVALYAGIKEDNIDSITVKTAILIV